VTEIIPGRTLDDELADGARRDPRGVIGLLEPIASALDYAHSRATVHRDVKPANILLADDGRTMLTGFGLGTVASFSNGPGAAGPMAPDYVAPERLVGREVDARADVYSLAAVIFHAVTGQRPFTSRSWIETLSRRLYEPPPSAREVVPEIPEAFARVLQQAMDREVGRRPTTAGELMQSLLDALDPQEPAEEKVHWLQTHMQRGSVVVSGILVLVVGVAGVSWLLDGAGLSLVVAFSHVLTGR
jgi:serine/threonine-protein kinase